MRNLIILLTIMSLGISACSQLTYGNGDQSGGTPPITQPPADDQPEPAPPDQPANPDQPKQPTQDRPPTGPASGSQSPRPPQGSATGGNQVTPPPATAVVEASKLNNLDILVNKQISLPSDYVPRDLVKPAVPFAEANDQPKHYMRKEAAEALERLFAKAREEGIELVAVSGYRSYARQKEIFEWNAKQEGVEKANQTSAKPGQSEHQTGLAMDVSTSRVNYALTESFGDTPEGKWLKQNAPSFGFIIRYPKGKEHITGYSYEPWHIRYVGVEMATEIAARGLTLEEYLLGVPAHTARR